MAYRLEHRSILPGERRHATPLLLLHGAWHGAWCWEAAMADFARRGFEVHAVSLRGHGESESPRPVNWWGIDDYVRDLGAAVEAIEPRPVIVGHSMGGFIAQHYLTGAGAAQIPGAVLLCSIPNRGALGFFLRYARRHPLPFLRTFATLNTWHMVGPPPLARDAFFRDDIPPEELTRLAARLTPESLRVALEAGLLRFPDPRRRRAPLLLIAAERDRVFTLAEQRATAAAYDAELVVVPDAAHDLMLDPAWPAAADAIERFVMSLARGP